MRAPLPSERRSIESQNFAYLDEHSDFEQEHDDTQGFDVCEEIRALCDLVQSLSDQQRAKLWELLRMPFAPLTAVSCLATLAACARVIPQVLAGGIGAGSVSYSGMRAVAFYTEYRQRSTLMRSAMSRIRDLLPYVEERDILIVRSMFDRLPEIRQDCSNW